MNQEERDVIGGIFDRLKQAEHNTREPEAEAFIREKVAKQPYAPYVMAQIIFTQEQALANSDQRIQQLENELQKTQSAPASSGFLSGLFGVSRSFDHSSSRPDLRASSAQASSLPPAGGPGAAQPSGAPGGGFLASAMTTTAGVAGGMVAGNVLANALGLGSTASAHAAPAGDDRTAAAQPEAEKTAASAAEDSADDDDF